MERYQNKKLNNTIPSLAFLWLDLTWLRCEFPHWPDTTKDKLLSNEGFSPVMAFETKFSELADSEKENRWFINSKKIGHGKISEQKIK